LKSATVPAIHDRSLLRAQSRTLAALLVAVSVPSNNPDKHLQKARDGRALEPAAEPGVGPAKAPQDPKTAPSAPIRRLCQAVAALHPQQGRTLVDAVPDADEKPFFCSFIHLMHDLSIYACAVPSSPVYLLSYGDVLLHFCVVCVVGSCVVCLSMDREPVRDQCV
jgi:hypothetical protein